MLANCAALLTLCLILASQQDLCRAQLSFHTDANTNSFTLKAPGLQHSFTRFYGAAKQQPQPAAQQLNQPQYQTAEEQQQQQLQQQELQQNPTQFAGLSPAGLQYSTAYPQQALGSRLKSKPAAAANTLQQQQQQQLQQQQYLAQQQQLQAAQAANVPTYADQMQNAFLEYQRQRQEFEQQQQQLLHKLYTYYPDVSGQQQQQAQPQLQQQQQQQQPIIGSRFATRQSANAFGSNNGLQQQPHQAVPQQPQLQSQQQPTAATAGPQNFYSTHQHLGFLQQQQQEVLRDQQQNVAQQFANSQLAPSTSQNYGMAIPESAVLGSASYQPSSDVSHVSFSSGNLNYKF